MSQRHRISLPSSRIRKALTSAAEQFSLPGSLPQLPTAWSECCLSIRLDFSISTQPTSRDPKLLKFVRVGSDLDWRGGQLIEVYKMVHHSKYTSYHEVDATYDYGVVILKTPIIFNRNITVAHLARRRLPEGTMLTLSGYGSGRVLKQTRIPIYNQRECIANYAYIPLEVDPHVSFCAGYKYANTTSCFGDSGGPLIYGKRILYGIVSWGDDDCQVQDFPAVYSRVDTMAEWFQSFMDEYK